MTAERSVVRWDGERADAPARAAAPHRRRGGDAVAAGVAARVDGPVPAADVLADAVVAEPGGRPVAAGDTVDRHRAGGRLVAGRARRWRADRVSLGPNVLRVETAAVVAATLLVARMVRAVCASDRSGADVCAHAS